MDTIEMSNIEYVIFLLKIQENHPKQTFTEYIGDMIKGNESDVANIDFEL